jgi:tyrosinase
MSNVSRRSFIAGLSAVPFAIWFEKNALAQPPRVRPNVMSTQGQAMLNVYADAVKIMMNTPERNPMGWLFQWYTHGVRADRTKASEIARVYPSPSAQRTLAQQTWDTCQAHHSTDIEDFFLPWHRMYLFFFERIIQRVTNNSSFALPYWDYTNASSPSGPRLPNRFLSPANASNPLFRQNRRASVNAGNPIDQTSPGALNLNSLAQCSYSRVGAVQGFNLNLDSNLHGTVHVLVGNSLGMGNVPWAANDPIFWLHHCNIDRLWASWNDAGRKNPNTAAWLNKQFVFADENGVRVSSRVRDFRNIMPLHYRYEELAPVPACPPGTTATGAPRVRARVASAVQLSSTPVRANLAAPPSTAAGLQDLPTIVRNLGPNRRLFLVIRNLNAQAPPGTLFDVFLELPEGASGSAAESNKIGSIHFFDAVPHGGHGAAAANAEQKFFSFDITDLAKRLVNEGRFTATPVLTIAPADQVEATARPVVGEIQLIEQ